MKLKILKRKLLYFKKPFHKQIIKWTGELLPGSGRKKNKLTFTKMLRIFIFKLTWEEIQTLPKHEYRKILKQKGLLK